MAVLLVGSGDQREQRLLADAIETRGHKVINCDVRQWPNGPPLTVIPESDTAVVGTAFDYTDITGAYVNYHQVFQPYDLRFRDQFNESFFPVLNQLREYRGLFESICRTLEYHGTTVIPPLRNHHLQDRKPWQLHIYEDSDVPIPDTVFTNDPTEVRSFYEAHDRVIYKPITRGGVPHELTADDLVATRLETLATAPVQFQEYIEGDDLRVYVLNGEVVGAIAYESEQFSFKLDIKEGNEDSVAVHPVTLSDDISTTVTHAADQAGFIFTAADIRQRPDGTYALLELNEAPRFAAADLRAGQDIAGTLAEFLRQ